MVSRFFGCRSPVGLPGGRALPLLALLVLPLAGCAGGDGGRNRLVAVHVAGGASAVAAGHEAGAGAFDGAVALEVPEGSRRLLVVSVPGLANADLAGVRVVVTSPDGARRIVLEDGAAVPTGFVEVDLPDADPDGTLAAFATALRQALPASFVEEDLYGLMERGGALLVGEGFPRLPEGVAADLAVFGAALEALDDAVVRFDGVRTPTRGVRVYGPQAGDWRVEVAFGKGVEAFEVRVLALPGEVDLATVDALASALASAREDGIVASAQEAGCTGCDPGCDRAIDAWRHPSPGTQDWERAVLLRGAWALFEGIVIVEGAACLALALAALVPVETVAAIAAVFALSSETFIAVVALTASTIFQAITDFDNVAEDLYWRFAWAWWDPLHFGTACHFGLADTSPRPPFTLAPGGSVYPVVTVLNALRRELAPETWAHGTAGAGQPLQWDADREDVVELEPTESNRCRACTVRAVASPGDDAAKVTVTLPSQPARRDFDVAITDRTCTLPDAIVVFGTAELLDLEVDPAPPTEGAMEYEWNATELAGHVTSADGDAVPFTSEWPFAHFDAGQKVATDLVEVKAVHVAASGDREVLCTTVGRIDVVKNLALDPQSAQVGPGGIVTFTCTGCDDLEGDLVFSWETLGLQGSLLDAAGQSVNAFESATAKTARYQASDEAKAGGLDWVRLHAWSLESGSRRLPAGFDEAQVTIRAQVPPCNVNLYVYNAPADYQFSDPNPNDVTCALAEGTWVIDPESLDGCVTAAPCQGQCLGYGDPVSVGTPLQWHTYDLEGNSTGGNHCGTSGRGSCEADLAWAKRACAENFCEDASMEGGGFKCAACSCACGGGNCYPWRGPGRIVFDAFTNVPCTDVAECFYHHAPPKVEGWFSFRLVHCPSVDNALPNCPGNIPKPSK